MNEKPEEGPGIVVGYQWRRYWHMDYDVLMQEHIQLQENSIHHLRSEVDKEIDELWRLIQQYSNRLYRGQKKKGRLVEKNGTGECNGKLQNKVWKLGKLKPAMNCDDKQREVSYMKKMK